MSSQSKSSIHEEFQKFESLRGRANKILGRKGSSSSSSSSSSDERANRNNNPRNVNQRVASQRGGRSKEKNTTRDNSKAETFQKELPQKSEVPRQKVDDSEDSDRDDEDFNMRQSILQHSIHGQSELDRQQSSSKTPDDLEPERDGSSDATAKYRAPRKGKSRERRDDSIYICNTNSSPIKYDAVSRNISATQQTSQATQNLSNTGKAIQQFNNTGQTSMRSAAMPANVAGTPQTPSFQEKARDEAALAGRSAGEAGFVTQQKQLDEQFVIFMLQVEERYQQNLSKKHRKQVEQWSKVLCQIIDPKGKDNDELIQIRKNRNLYAVKLMDQIISLNCLEDELLEDPPKDLANLPSLDLQETQKGLSKRFQQAVKDLNSYGNDILQEDEKSEKNEQPGARSKELSAVHDQGKPQTPYNTASNFELLQPNDLAVPPSTLKPPKMQTFKDNRMRSPMTGAQKLLQSKSPRMPEHTSKSLSLQMIPTKQGAKQNRCASSRASSGAEGASLAPNKLLAQQEAQLQAHKNNAMAHNIQLEQEMASLKSTIGHQKTQIENLEIFVEKKQAHEAELKLQIKQLTMQIEEKEAENQKYLQSQTKDKKLYEKMEREAKLREALVLKQTDIIDNITRQLQRANDDKLRLKEALDASNGEVAKMTEQLEKMQDELEQRIKHESGLKEASAQISQLDQLLIAKDEEIKAKVEEIDGLKKEKGVLKGKNEKYQELSEKLLQQLEERDNDEESKDRRVDRARLEMQEEHQQAMEELTENHQAEMQNLKDRLALEFEQKLAKKDQEMDQMRDEYIKMSDDLKRKESQIAHLEERIHLMEADHQNHIQNADQKAESKNVPPKLTQRSKDVDHGSRQRTNGETTTKIGPGAGRQLAQSEQPNGPGLAAAQASSELTKSELIIQRCENYIKKSQRDRSRSSHRGDQQALKQIPSQRAAQQSGVQFANSNDPGELFQNQNRAIQRQSSSEAEDRIINVDNVVTSFAAQNQLPSTMGNQGHQGEQPPSLKADLGVRQYDRQSNGSLHSLGSSNGGHQQKVNQSLTQTQQSGRGAANDSKNVSSSQVLIGALAAMGNKDGRSNSGNKSGAAGQPGLAGIPPLIQHNLSQYQIQESNYVPLRTQNIPPKSTRSSNAYDDSAKQGVKDLIGGGGAISGISAVASSVNVSQLNPNLSVHKSVQVLPGLPPKALQMTNTSQMFSSNHNNSHYPAPKALKEIYHSMTSQQHQYASNTSNQSTTMINHPQHAHMQAQQQNEMYLEENMTTQKNNQTQIQAAHPTRIQRAHQELEDTSNFEKTMPSPPYNNGVSQETALPNNIHHGEHTQKLIQDIQNVQRHSEMDTRGGRVRNSSHSDQQRQPYLESQYGPITATQSVIDSQTNLTSTMEGLPDEGRAVLNDADPNGAHQKRYSQFEQRQDIQTYRTLCQEEESADIIDHADLGLTGETSQDQEDYAPIQHTAGQMHRHDFHPGQHTQDGSEYGTQHQRAMLDQMSLQVPLPNGVQATQQKQPKVEHKRQGFQLNLGQVNQLNHNHHPSHQVSNNCGQSTARGAYQQFQGARQLSSRIHTFRKDESGNKGLPNERRPSSALGTNEGVRSNDRYDKLYDELINEEDLLNEQSQLREQHHVAQQRPQYVEQPQYKMGPDQEESPQSYYDNDSRRQPTGHEVNQSDLEIQRHLYAIQQRHLENQVDAGDLASDSEFTTSRHQTNVASANHCSTASVSQTNRKMRGEESTASRQLRLIQNRYAKQSAQMMDDNDQFEQIIDEDEHEMQSSSRDSYPYHGARPGHAHSRASRAVAVLGERSGHPQPGQHQISEEVAGRAQQFPTVPDDEDEDLFKLSQFLTKRGNQNSVDQTKSNSVASQKMGSTAGHGGGAQISMRNIESANVQEAYGCGGADLGGQPHGVNVFGGPVGVQMTESMMKSRFRPNNIRVDDDKSPMYCPDTVDKNFDKFVDDLL